MAVTSVSATKHPPNEVDPRECFAAVSLVGLRVLSIADAELDGREPRVACSITLSRRGISHPAARMLSESCTGAS